MEKEELDEKRRISLARLATGFSKFSITEKFVLTIFDAILVLFIILPCVIGFWTATSTIIDVHSSDHNNDLGRIFFIIACSIVYFLLQLLQIPIYNFVRKYLTNFVIFKLFSTFYLYIFSLSGLILLNIPWTLIDECKMELLVIVLTVGSLLFLWSFRILPNISGGVTGVGQESTPEEIYLFTRTRNYTWKKNKLLYLLDSIFSVLIVGTLVILVWRGAWNLLDCVVFPEKEDIVKSSWCSLIMGYAIVILTFILQPIVKKLIRVYGGWKRLLIIDFYVLFSFCGTINVWRGLWYIFEIYFNLAELKNCIILHVVSFLVLVMFNSANTLLVRGVYIDADEDGEDCVEFPCYYFRLMYQERKKNQVSKDVAVSEVLIESKNDVDLNRTNNERDKNEEKMITNSIIN